MIRDRKIERHGNKLVFQDLASPACLSDFHKHVYDLTKEGVLDVILDFSSTERVFPEACVPLSAFINLLTTEGMRFDARSASSYLVTSRMMSPLTVDTARARDSTHPLAKVWRFNESAEVFKLVTMFVEALAAAHVCSTGVLEGYEWCLNEVLDNVLQHSDGSAGFVMMQVHRSNNRLSICISDHGQGIFRSLSESKYRPTSALNALTLAVKAGVTRDPAVGQGNGLWGLSEIVRRNSGSFNLISGPAAIFFDGQTSKTFERLPCNKGRHGTSVIFQINTDKPIDVSEALGGGKYHHTNLFLESLETSAGSHEIKVQSISHGTGTRRSGLSVRTYVLNIFEQGSQRVVLDFSDVGMISSSFADELIGKLAAHFGFVAFAQRVTLKNVNETILPLIDRSVSQRLATTLAPPP